MTCDDTHALADLRVGCYNCNGMGGKHKRDQVLNWLKTKIENIIFIQETHSTKETEADWKKTWGMQLVLIMVLVNLPVCSSNISYGFCSDHSYVTLTLQGNPLIHGRGYWKFNNTHLSS